MNKIEVWCDGICEPINPGGIGAIGVIVKRNGEVIHIISKVIGEGKNMSNNVAEYTALKEALDYLKNNGYCNSNIYVYGDSKLVIEQMSGHWAIKNGLYKDIALVTQILAKSFNNITFSWIPREQNIDADTLTRNAYAIYGGTTSDKW